MADDSRRKRTFAQKAGRFFRSLTLCTAFAAVAGTGYNYFGTQADVMAKVTSVDPAPTGDVIHTDKGNFVNTPSWVFSKNPDDVEALQQKLKPGATLQMHFYGAHMQLGGHSPEDFGLYRNITDAVVVSPPPPPVVVQPPPVARDPNAPKPANVLTVPAAMVNANGDDAEDTMTPEACAANDDLAAISTNMPRLARDLDIMRQLPITGKPVYDMMKDPKNHMKSCLFPVPPNTGSTSSYSKHQARIARGTGTSVTFHEFFHAMQAVHEGRNDMFTLTQKDGAVANMLTEASAVAFELASRQEALNHGLQFYGHPDHVVTWTTGNVIHTQTFSIHSPADNPENIKAFQDAYKASLTANAGLDEQSRQAAALEAGGQAVVDRLMKGLDDQWNATNSALIIDNVNQNPRAFHADDTAPGYGAKRDRVFSNQGDALKTVNFIPPKFLGPTAGPAIDTAFQALGFKIVPKTPAPAAPSAPKPTS